MRITPLLGRVLTLAVLLAPAPLAVRADAPADGFYRLDPPRRAPDPARPEWTPGERLSLSIDQAFLVAMSNQNASFELRLRLPYDGALSSPGSLGLVLGGVVHASRGAGSSGTTWSHQTFLLSGQESAEAAAKFLGIAPHLRRHPGHRLDATFMPVSPRVAAGPAPRVTFRMTNVGASTVAFQQGGRSRGSRDNQFEFLARHAGRVVPDVGSSFHLGGLSVRRVLKPGETFDAEVDLAKWFTFDAPGLVEILGTYALTLFDPDGDDHTPLWEDFATAAFLLEVVGPAPATAPSADAEGAMVGAWTPAIRGMRARLVTALDDLDRGGRFVSVYVEFEHVYAYSSDIEIPSDRQLEVELLDEAQQPVPKRSFPYSGPGSEPKAISLSNGGRCRSKISAGGCGVPPDGVLICFLGAAWFIPDTDKRAYFIRATLRCAERRGGPNHWVGVLELPTTPIDRVPTQDRK